MPDAVPSQDLRKESLAGNRLDLSSEIHTFPVGWGSFSKDLRKQDGFVDFVVVDDYTDYCLWDKLLYGGVERIGSKPEGLPSDFGKDLPAGNWRMLNAMHTMATDGVYAQAGITKPTFEQLPAVYCIVHGKTIGRCIFNAQVEKAVEFMKEQLSAV